MSGQGRDITEQRSIVPSSPFEIQATQDLLQKRIENGEITQADVDLVKQGYRWMSISATVGTLTCGLGTYIALRRRRPPVNMAMRLLGGGAMGMMGSFIGFTIGGAAASMEVEKNMADAPRKMRVFAEVAQDTRRQIIEHRAHQIEERTGRNPFPNGQGLPPTRQQRESGSMTEPTWDPEGSEKAMEAERQREMPDDLGVIKDDASFAGTSDAKERDLTTGTGVGEARQEITRATKGTWDKIRQKTFGGGDKSADVPTPNLGGGRAAGGAPARRNTGEDARSKEQREFDEMLEKERQGGVIGDKWA